jgi:protein-tyrosine phosphatase
VLNLCRSKDPYECEVHRWDPISDTAPAPSVAWLRQNVEFIEAQRRNYVTTYVHCRAGVSRAGLVTTAYLIKKHQWTRDRALEFIRTKRPQVRPNAHFMERLREWENVVLAERFGGKK